MLSQACQRCWGRKQKCDRQSPECSTCLAAGVKCLPRVWGRVVDSEVSTGGDQHISTRSSIEYLKCRIQYLEHEAAQNTNSQAHGDNRALSTGVVSASAAVTVTVTPTTVATNSVPPPAQVNRLSVNSRRIRSARHDNNIDVDPGTEQNHRVADVAINEVEYLSLAAMSGGGGNDRNTPQNSVLEQAIKSIVSLHGLTVNLGATTADRSNIVGSSDESSLLTAMRTIQLSSGKDYKHMAQLFATITTWYLPIVPESECFNAFETANRFSTNASATNQTTPRSLPADEGGAEAGTEALATPSSIMVLGTIASSYHQALDSTLHNLVDSSKQSLPQILTTANDSNAIQCLILQSTISLYYPSAGSAWHLLGLALTKAIAAGFHRLKASSAPDTTNNESTDPSNIFWSLYVLDRTLASMIGWPFGLEDSDITLKPPQTSIPPSNRTNPTVFYKALWAWKVHHALLLSHLRRNVDKFDLGVSFASYEYWKASYIEVFERSKLSAGDRTDNDGNADVVNREHIAISNALVTKEEAQLSCRMLVHILDQATLKLSWDNAALITFKKNVNGELARIIDILHNAIEAENIKPSVLDAYDALATAIAYVVCIYKPDSFQLGVTQIRTITTSIDVIQHVAQSFRPTRGFKDIIWTFLQCLENKADTEVMNRLMKATADCEIQIPIPQHIKRLIKYCTDM